MYHGEFIKAKNYQGKLYRDKKSGNLIEHCSHNFVIYPIFGSGTEYHAEFIPLEKKTFEGFTGVCQECGEVIHINPEDVVKNSQEQERILNEALIEVSARKEK